MRVGEFGLTSVLRDRVTSGGLSQLVAKDVCALTHYFAQTYKFQGRTEQNLEALDFLSRRWDHLPMHSLTTTDLINMVKGLTYIS